MGYAASPTLLAPGTGFMEDNFSTDWSWWGCGGGGTLYGFAMNKVHYIYCALYFSSTSYHQALDPGGWRLLG